MRTLTQPVRAEMVECCACEQLLLIAIDLPETDFSYNAVDWSSDNGHALCDWCRSNRMKPDKCQTRTIRTVRP